MLEARFLTAIGRSCAKAFIEGRIETDSENGVMTTSSKQQFDGNAEKYATSEVHRAGPSLPVLLRLAAPHGADEALDVATGTGHTAIAVARYAKKVIGIDIAPKMLEQARRLAAEQKISNCVFLEGTAERIPLEDGQFSLVTSRHAPHHFQHVDLFLNEIRRVLAPAGRFVMSDQISPSPELSDWIDQWERTRDPSHFKQRTVEEWGLLIAAARLRWMEHRIVPYRLQFDWWVRQAGCSAPAIASLVQRASIASPQVRESLGLEFDSTGRITSFLEPMLVMRAELA
jgi:ubiquinone/menaquinone biosynthesis C-methylase UbiE